MTVREFVGVDQIAQNYVGKPDRPEWDETLSDEEQTQLSDAAFLDEVEEEHKELMAFMLFRHGSSLYPPEKLSERIGHPVRIIFAFYGIRGNARTGTY